MGTAKLLFTKQGYSGTTKRLESTALERWYKERKRKGVVLLLYLCDNGTFTVLLFVHKNDLISKMSYKI